MKKDKLPGYPDPTTGEFMEMELFEEYTNAPVMLVQIQHNKTIIKTMYFVFTNGRWWLVIIDDCDCSA